eukprot:GILJ01001834.1.p1 GENE.GILJ01001834.1~~GILJ01001834.1.p1  ORF type:complete len:502 (-),score=85.85 GILJ01001834.1:179-1684(-)
MLRLVTPRFRGRLQPRDYLPCFQSVSRTAVRWNHDSNGKDGDNVDVEVVPKKTRGRGRKKVSDVVVTPDWEGETGAMKVEEVAKTMLGMKRMRQAGQLLPLPHTDPWEQFKQMDAAEQKEFFSKWVKGPNRALGVKGDTLQTAVNDGMARRQKIEDLLQKLEVLDQKTSSPSVGQEELVAAQKEYDAIVDELENFKLSRPAQDQQTTEVKESQQTQASNELKALGDGIDSLDLSSSSKQKDSQAMTVEDIDKVFLAGQPTPMDDPAYRREGWSPADSHPYLTKEEKQKQQKDRQAAAAQSGVDINDEYYMKQKQKRGENDLLPRPTLPKQRKYRNYVPQNVSWKDVSVLARFIGKTGEILPKWVTGLSTRDQRRIAFCIKTARQMGVMPFISPLQAWMKYDVGLSLEAQEASGRGPWVQLAKEHDFLKYHNAVKLDTPAEIEVQADHETKVLEKVYGILSENQFKIRDVPDTTFNPARRRLIQRLIPLLMDEAKKQEEELG